MNNLQTQITSYYSKVIQWLIGTIEIWLSAARQYNRVQGLEASAAIAYFAIFSLFPLMLTLVAIAGYLLGDQAAVDIVLKFILDLAPTIPSWLERSLRQIVAQRSINSVIGLVGLLISASGVFLTLVRNINRAWPNAKTNTLIRGHLIAFGMIAGLATMLVLWLIWSSLVSLLIVIDIPLFRDILQISTLPLNPVYRLFYWLTSFGFFFIIYKWLPNLHVKWSEAFWGAMAAALMWNLLTLGFTWFLSGDLSRYDLLYGSLGTSVALLTWTYLSATITLFGAHLSASIARARRASDSIE